ncbi:simple sugar transport system substrate-binding protein [Paenibacillus sp. RU4T]|uniref:sugar ABC transporter substrate-binding protein n=1 Tax=unclassified Paenibacillus TaxID=185978 RepID=UPI00095428FB|nr:MULTISPECIES: sugar ABC transporter substrate-binding protein [unclassified Paenibacillus]SIQ47748.1 simple sugar transport system substrate-binding protein [Paenibacillus sp. RU4X]SIQ69583.1 simple sugar transport system substrate-binding protein [Paenibacillus sp. RU4T]
MNWGKKSLIVLAAAAILGTAACGQKGNNSEADGAGAGGSAAAGKSNGILATLGDGNDSLKGKKIALIMQFNEGAFSAQYVAGVKEQVESFGGTVQVQASGNNLAEMSSKLEAAVNGGVDGILTDHGTAEALKSGVEKAVSKGIPVVAFDADIAVPGVTVLQQNDQDMADKSLEKLKTDIGGKGNIVKVWVAGFAPMERRQISYKKFMDANPDIKEIAHFGTADKPALDTQNQMEAILKQYPNKGDIAAVWASWDEFAKGAVRAIQQAGRNEIKVYGIDMSDEDLQMIQDPNSPWIASVAVDPKDIGRVQARYLYQKLHGDKTDDKVVLDAVAVTRDALPKDKKINTTELSEYVEGWGKSEQGIADWMGKTGN